MRQRPSPGGRGTRRLLSISACVLALAACDGSRAPDPTGPPPPPPPPPPAGFLQITKLGGSDLRGTAGEPLDESITVEVRDDAGRAVPGVTVAFSTLAGTVVASSPVTDAAGRASAEWTLDWTPGPQELRVNVEAGQASASLTLVAVAAVNPAADLVVARGAEGRSVVLAFVEGQAIRRLLTLDAGDTIVYLPPDSDFAGQWIAALTVGRLPALAQPASHAGTDTTELWLTPPFEVPLTVWLVNATPALRAGVGGDLATLNGFWAANPWGLQVGEVRIHEIARTGQPISCHNAPANESGTIDVYYSTEAEIGGFGGMACSPRTIIMRLAGAAYLLPHELGHAFDLWHPPTTVTANFMHQSATHHAVALWQIYNAHFSGYSALNSVYGLRSTAEQQACCIAGW